MLFLFTFTLCIIEKARYLYYVMKHTIFKTKVV